MTNMTDYEKYKLLNKITKYTGYFLEVAIVVAVITLGVVVGSQRRTIKEQEKQIIHYEHYYGPVQQEQN